MFEKDCDTFPEEPDTLGEHVSFLHSKDNLKSHLDGFKSSGASFWKTSWAIHGCLILLYTTFSACIIFILGFEREVAEVNRNALPELRVEHSYIRFPLMRDTPFIGQPSTSVDDAWSKLLHNMSLRVTDAELEKQSHTSIPLPRGGNIAWLGVFHELHCIKMFRKANYREHYHPEAKGQVLRDLQVHVDHCIELLRASAMCRPDLETLTTFKWGEGLAKPLLSPERDLRRCVDWNTLMKGLENRVVDEKEMAELHNPLSYTLPEV